MDRILKILPEQKPHLVLINFKEPDFQGHAKNYFKYILGIQSTDELAAKLWTWIQSQWFTGSWTALFITNDHGRHAEGHLNGYVSHGDDCPSCHHIALLAMGPDFKKGAVIDTHRGQIDVAETAAEILGVKLPASKGTLLTELLAK